MCTARGSALIGKCSNQSNPIMEHITCAWTAWMVSVLYQQDWRTMRTVATIVMSK